MMRAALLFACLISAPAIAADTPAAPEGTAAPAAKPAAKEKKICRLQESESTSRMRKRVCTTVAEAENAERNQSNLDDRVRVEGR
jgi:hypothetical protein